MGVLENCRTTYGKALLFPSFSHQMRRFPESLGARFGIGNHLLNPWIHEGRIHGKLRGGSQRPQPMALGTERCWGPGCGGGNTDNVAEQNRQLGWAKWNQQKMVSFSRVYDVCCMDTLYDIIYRSKFRSQTSDNMDRWKAEQGRGREKRKIRRKDQKRKSKKKEDADARKGRKVAKHCVFPIICGSGGSKRRLAKAAGAEPAGQMRDETLHAVVARSTFWSQNVQSTPASDHFWKLRCRKSARRCGTKHVLKSKCTKHTILGPLLEVEMLKKCTPLWREAHFEVKMYKTHHSRTTFGSWDVEKVHAVVARSTFWSQHVKNTRGSDHFWRFRCRFASLQYTTLHYTTLHYTTLHYTTLHYTTLQLQLHNYTPLHCTTLNYTTLHYITLRYTPLHYTTVHYTALPSTTLHYITLHCTTLQLQLHNYTPLHYTTLHYFPLHSTTLHYSTLHYTPLHYTTVHYTTLHYTTLHYTTLPSTTPHYITLHYTPLHYNFNYNYDYTTTLHYTPLHEITLHYITLNDSAPQLDR